jgi:hypothetical protein
VLLRNVIRREHRILLVAESTVAGPNLREVVAFASGMDQQLLPPVFDSLKTGLSRPFTPMPVKAEGLDLPLRVRLLRPSEWVQLQKGEWGAFRFSAVFFNSDTTRALLYFEIFCAPWCAAGEHVLLARQPGARWTVWIRRRLWV